MKCRFTGSNAGLTAAAVRPSPSATSPPEVFAGQRVPPGEPPRYRADRVRLRTRLQPRPHRRSPPAGRSCPGRMTCRTTCGRARRAAFAPSAARRASTLMTAFSGSGDTSRSGDADRREPGAERVGEPSASPPPRARLLASVRRSATMSDGTRTHRPPSVRTYRLPVRTGDPAARHGGSGGSGRGPGSARVHRATSRSAGRCR